MTKYYTEEALNAMSNDDLIGVFNEFAKMTGARETTRFASKAAGVKRTLGIQLNVKQLASSGELDKPEVKVTHAPTKAAKGAYKNGRSAPKAAKPAKAKKDKGEKKPAKEKGERKARAHKFAGKRFTAAHLIENPRQSRSVGYKSLQLIIDRPGITYEDFLAKGGRYQDLKWDLGKGYAKEMK